ncbi:MAG: two-component system, NtrC family, sensor kinase [Methyloprofundus sp.]|nr:MAG: two-component system, NtrC family, sensor kinase [Methyloprofundus sp.]
MHKLIYRPFVIIGLILGILIIAELGALSSMTWRNQQRIDTIKQDIKQGNQLQQLVFELLKHQWEESVSTSLVIGQAKRHQADVHNKFIDFIENQDPAIKNTRELLKVLQKLLISVEQGNQQDQIKILQLSRKVLLQQMQEEEKLLGEVYLDSQLELKLAILIPSGVFLILLILGFLFLNRHIMVPVNALDKLLSNLIEGEKQPIKDINVDSMIQPLFNNYNRLVTRLSELEQEHQLHTQLLEKEVRNATHTLLEQSNSLARADRLAAVGELAASAAHELRNPLAGIQVALENMLLDCDDEDMSERLQLVNSEINRLTGRLNDLLSFAKQTPEKAKAINLYGLIDELMTLLKYQVKENISLQYQLEENITVFLPESELRQALLNLLLNAIQSIGTEEGRVNLKVEHQDSKLIIDISDTGAAFPDSLLEQGIRPFVSYKEKGTGLGLPMVQRFAKSFGGALELKNDSQGYACATLIFPDSQ